MLIDEYQGFVNTESSNGVITDDSWGSISRSFENINIYATQSIRHLDNAIGDVATDVIMSNCASEIILRAQDSRTLEHIERVYGKSLKGDLEFLINPCERSCAARMENNGAKHCFRGSMDVPEQAMFHSIEYKDGKRDSIATLSLRSKQKELYAEGLFISKNMKSCSEITMSDGERVRGRFSFLEKYVRCDDGLRDAYNRLLEFNQGVGELMLLTPYSFDFGKEKIPQLINRINKIAKMKESIRGRNYTRTMTSGGFEYVPKPNLAPTSLKLESDVLFVCKDTYKGWEDVSAKIDIPSNKRVTISELRSRKYKVEEKIICFVMGGGDLSSRQFDYFRSYDEFMKVKKQNPNGLIYTGVAHATDAFVFDYSADRSFITPTELAEYLIKLGYRKKY